MADDIILLSVKGMKRDGIKTFLNDDNSIGREDCLLFERDGRRFVVPFMNTHAYQVPIGPQSERAAVADEIVPEASIPDMSASHVTTKRSVRSPLQFHIAMGHVGVDAACATAIL